MRPYDLQSEVLREIEALLACPDLDAEELGRVLLTLEGFVQSRLVTPSEAEALLADRMGVR